MRTEMNTDFSSILRQFDGMENEAIDAAKEALEESAQIVAQKTKRAVASSRFDFDRPPQEVKRAVIDRPQADVIGTSVEVHAGFDLQGILTGHRGYPSIFLMHGTPEIEPDRNLYDAIFSARTKREVQEKQLEIFYQKMNEGE